MDKMTSRERVLALFNRKPVDRIPVLTGSVMVQANLEKAGATWPDFHYDAEMMLNGASVMHTDLGLDCIVGPFGMFTESMALGLEVKMGKYNIQPSVRSAFKKPQEVDYSKFLEQPIIQTTLDFIRLGKEKFPDALILPFLVGPVTLAGYFMGPENLSVKSMKALQKDKEAAKMKEWLDVAVEVAKIYAGACIDAGAEVVYFSDASASPNLVMPEYYYKFGVPAEKELFEFVHSKGALVELHICGNSTPIVEGMAQTGADVLSVEQTIAIEKAVELAGDVPVVGNVTPTLMADDFDEVKDAIVKETIDGLDQGAKGSMLGCGTPPMSNPENLKLWVDTVKEWSEKNL